MLCSTEYERSSVEQCGTFDVDRGAFDVNRERRPVWSSAGPGTRSRGGGAELREGTITQPVTRKRSRGVWELALTPGEVTGG